MVAGVALTKTDHHKRGLSMDIILYAIDELQKEILQITKELDEEARRSIKEYFRIGLTYSSNALDQAMR